ncbi:hypothetical protein [Variovorax sp. UMC13]|uniref:hypothetical protein n=1 Tax=Variovorax sp. UMC13 TaxID=1862326 RepID=UPI001600B2C8|nr:hypothetical protein [Variovorax sp. UMC13]MBB1601554.1 hypothetical protein [Variovorax sp. UMC13]
MTAAQRLQVVLVALLPGDGTAVPATALQRAVGCTARDVAEAFDVPVVAGIVRHDVMSDSYAALKKGSALPHHADQFPPEAAPIHQP